MPSRSPFSSQSGRDSHEVLFAMDRVLASPMFRQSERMRRFLRFVVDHALRDDTEFLKESAVGIHVFDRPPGYDLKADPIVRVEARRLRRKLAEYYESGGAADHIVIEIPKGQYAPQFSARRMESEVPLMGQEQEGEEAPSTEATVTQEMIPEPEQVPEPGLSSTAQKSMTARPTWRMAAASVLAVVVFVAAFVASRQSRSPGRLSVAPLSAITNYAGNEFDAAISPDGKQVAFVWDGNRDNFDIYLKLADVGEPIRLTSHEAHDLHPAWSPDGRYLAFLRSSADQQELVVMPALGGSERRVASIRSDMAGWRADATQMVGNAGPAWSPDGKFLAVTNCPGSSGVACGIHVLPVDGGEARQITFPRGIANDFYPAFSPDGRYLSFIRRSSNSVSDVFVVDLHAHTTRQLTFDSRDLRGAAWSAQSNWLCVSSNRGGTYGLWRVTLSGEMQPVPTTTQRAISPAVSTDWIAYTDAVQNTNIWRTLKGDAKPSLLIASSGRNDSPQYSPDGRHIAFVSDRSGSWEIWVAKADGSGLNQLTSFGTGMVGAPRWSPDGNQIAFDARPGGHAQIFVVPAKGGGVRTFTNDAFENRMPNWSRDGKWLYFSSTRDGAVRLWKARMDGTETVRLTTQICYDSVESVNGDFVYFAGSGNGLWRVSTDGTNESPIPALAGVAPRRYWAVGREGIYYVAPTPTTKQSDLWFYRFATARTSLIGHIDGSLVFETPSLSVSPDGESVLYALQDIAGSDIQRVAIKPQGPGLWLRAIFER